VFAINYTPAVAQINFKGKAHVRGKKEDLEEIRTTYKEKKAPPSIIIQTISNIVFLESVSISRTLNIPPPIPLPKVPLAGHKKQKEPTYRA
jgi:predicted pyridoxine 5'-phosphate oxidase superfamily flavin-nucleotide-binding protein